MGSSTGERKFSDSRWAPDDVPWLIGGLAAIAVLMAAFAYALDTSALDAWTGLIVFLVILAVSVPLFRWVARKEQDPWLYRVLFWALLAHMAFAMLRFFFIFVIYNGQGDAGIYHEAGATFARHFRDGEPIHPIPIVENFPVESQRIGDVVGVLYSITGPSVYAGFLFFSYICFWGQVLVVRAFKAAVPEGDYRRFAVLVLFLPSLLFWPASIGKEALMIGCLGVICYGGGLLLAPRPKARGALFFIAGILLVLMVRPHVALMSIGALGLAMAVGSLAGSGARDAAGKRIGSGRGRALRIAALVLLVVLAGSASTRLSATFDETGKASGTQESLDKALRQSSIGNAEFAPVTITGPSRVPAGVVSVLVRPFPWEARNMNSLIAAAEGLLLVGLVAISWRRVASFPRLALRRPFLVFATTYILLFSIGFSFIGNFGILARQRVQVMPIVLILLALPPLPRRSLAGGRPSLFDAPAEESADVAGSVESMDLSGATER